MSTKYVFTVIVEQDEDGFSVTCPQIQGCYAQGDTYEEAMTNMKDALSLHIADRKSQKEKWSMPTHINVTSLELTVS